MRHKVIESFCEGKFRDDRNEDRLYVGPRHIAVIDGSSAAQPLAGRHGGIVAAETILEVIERLGPDADITAFEGATRAALVEVGHTHQTASPYAAAVVLSPRRREIWRIGDCPFAIDGNWNIPAHNPHEQAFFRFRQMMADGNRLAGRGGQWPAALEAGISGVTRDWLTMTKSWVNAHESPFAFAAVDERPAPPQFHEVYPLPTNVGSVVLASDGAVVARNGQRGPESVSQMLDRIAEVRASDPHCLSDFPYWRGFLDGASLLDDTTFVSIEF